MPPKTVQELIDELIDLNIPDYGIQCIVDYESLTDATEISDGFTYQGHAIGTGIVEIQIDKDRKKVNLFFEGK
ncbi:MAG: hypothetical protein ACYDDE_00415 [bacterium]